MVGNDTGDAELALCLVDALKRWEFHTELEGDVSWPFDFRFEPTPAAPSRIARVGVGSIVGSEQMDVAGATAGIRQNMADVKACYELGLQDDPELAGRVEVGFSVFEGKVEAGWIASDTTGDPELAPCVIHWLKRWVFPAGLEGDVSVPFTFASDARPAE